MRLIMQRIPKLRLLALLVVGVLCAAASGHASAISFSLDSIATWGKFPRFCVNTYRWGDKFFNTYDSAYVVGTGTKFNVKLTTDSWRNNYHFVLPDMEKIDMYSNPSTSAGVYLTYLAVSLGYDINVSRLFNGVENARSRYRFGFDCSLLAVELYWENNDVGTRIHRFGPYTKLDIPFKDIHIYSWGIDVYYFFNHKRYSQAAAFNFSKIQKRSEGSFYAGLAIFALNYDFDFSSLDKRLLDVLPSDWPNYHFATSTRNYGVRFGYGYNWVPRRNWAICASISPTVGFKRGYVNSSESRYSFSIYNHVKGSIVWNHGRWFIGASGKFDISLVRHNSTTFFGGDASVSGAVGYRFNLW